MTVVGLDDTDSREFGMCTTYVAARIAERLRSHGHVERLLLIRLNPAVEYKTRGNAALAIHTDCDPEVAFDVAREHLEALAETADEATNPGLVVADHAPVDAPEAVRAFARDAVRDHLEISEATDLLEMAGYRSWWAGNGRGRIGALAAIGSWRVSSGPPGTDEPETRGDSGLRGDSSRAVDPGDPDEAGEGSTSTVQSPTGAWSYEYISYRESDRWGTPRAVDHASVFAAADSGYPTVWDTVDRGEDETVCVPHTPGPILHGIRGDDPETVTAVARRIESEPVESTQLFLTNQGTDAHLRDGTLETVRDGRAYRVDGVVRTAPETRRGGHVFFTLGDRDAGAGSIRDGDDDGEDSDATATLECAAFEPTKRFRDRVRALRVGDRLTVCGEISRGTLKLEKFAVRDLVGTERVTPVCGECERTMESAGRNQGYRCRDCRTSRTERAEVALERTLEEGWYEVPPCARRHVARPLIRSGFDAPVHPER